MNEKQLNHLRNKHTLKCVNKYRAKFKAIDPKAKLSAVLHPILAVYLSRGGGTMRMAKLEAQLLKIWGEKNN